METGAVSPRTPSVWPERPQRDPKETPQRVQRRPLIPDRDRLPLGHAQSAPA